MKIFDEAKAFFAAKLLETEALEKLKFAKDRAKLLDFLMELLGEDFYEKLKPAKIKENSNYGGGLFPSFDGVSGRVLEFSLANRERNRRVNLKAKVYSADCIIYYKNNWLDIGASVRGIFDETGLLVEIDLEDKYSFVLFLERKLVLN